MARSRLPDHVREARRASGSLLRQRREAIGFSRYDLALVAGTSPSNVQSVEQGRSADALVRVVRVALDLAEVRAPPRKEHSKTA